jgi:hypothetical protein
VAAGADLPAKFPVRPGPAAAHPVRLAVAAAGHGNRPGQLLRPDVDLTVEQYWLSETIITACGMVGAGLTLLCLLRKPSPRGLLVAP